MEDARGMGTQGDVSIGSSFHYLAAVTAIQLESSRRSSDGSETVRVPLGAAYVPRMARQEAAKACLEAKC